MGQQRNTIVAVVLMAVILFAWQYWMSKTHPPAPPPQQTATAPAPAGTTATAPAEQTPAQTSSAQAPAASAAPIAAPATRAAALAATPRVRIVTPKVDGSISLKGARIDDLTLRDYRETPDPKSPPITLLSPPVASGTGAYYAEFGWSAGANGATAVPGRDTVWTASSDTLTPEKPVTLSWDNGAGLVFKRVYAIDANYMFTITDSVENATDRPVTLSPYGLISRWGTPNTENLYIHQGLIGYLDGGLDEEKYKSIKDDHPVAHPMAHDHIKGGWIGFTDKYWLTALVPDQQEEISSRMMWDGEAALDRYQTDWTGAPITAGPGSSAAVTSHLFAGAQVLDLLDAYSKTLNIPNFELAIDFGKHIYFLTIPLFKFLRWIHSWVPNFGLAILIFTVCVRGAFFPITARSARSMSKMKKLQPEIKKLQARYGEDRTKLNQEMMALYKREKANPVSGCLPLVLQIPVFLALYRVLLVSIEMRQAPFWGWIHDLSEPDPLNIFTAFGLIPWDPPALLHIGIWPLIMGVTMWLQQKLNPQPPDPIQARMFTILPVVFTFMLGRFPAGLVIYWSWSNTLSILQQWLITRRMNKDVKPDRAVVEAKKKG